MNGREGLPEEPTVDGFLGGLVTLVQPRSGHRAGLDAALLQALVPSSAAGLAVDLGAGVGTVAFCAAARAPALRVVGVEREAELVACGREALALSGNAAFSARVRLVAADAAHVAGLRAAGDLAEPADWVLMNPPYDRAGGGSASPDPLRRDAHVGAGGLLRDWTAAAADLLRPGGRLCLIHRTAALAEILQALSGRFGEIRVLPVHPRAGAPASRILVAARRGRRTPLSLAAGLVLHEPDGGWSTAADAILRGAAELDL